MRGWLDYFLPKNNGLDDAQQNSAHTQGLINAAATIANLTAPKAGPAATPLQLVTGGLQAYGQGANNYLDQFYKNQDTQATLTSDQAKATMAKIGADRANSYFTPQGKSDLMAGALAGSDPSSLSSFYDNSNNITGVNNVTSASLAPLNSGGLGTPSANIPTTQMNNSTAMRPTMGGTQTAFGVDTATMARRLYKQGMDLMMLQQPGGDKLIEHALSLDPSIIYEKAYTNSKGQAEGALPSDLTKIGATGAQARQTAGYEASLRPHDQPVMINGQLYTVPSNDAAAAQGYIPAGTTAPVANGISTAIPAYAKTASEMLGKNMAEAGDSQATIDSRMNSAISMIDEMKKLAPDTHVGEGGKLTNYGQNQLGANSGNVTQARFENLNSNLFTQELPGIIKGAGGRLDIPLLNAIKEASAVDPYAPVATKQAILDELRANLVKAQNNAHNKVNMVNGSSASVNNPASSSSGWSVRRIK